MNTKHTTILKSLTLTLVTGLLTSCGARHVRTNQLEGGIVKLEAVSSTKDNALRVASKKATKHCKKQKKTAIIQSEDVTYKGLVDEKTNQAIKTAGNIGGVILGQEAGSKTWGASRAATHDSTYTAMLKFRCE